MHMLLDELSTLHSQNKIFEHHSLPQTQVFKG